MLTPRARRVLERAFAVFVRSGIAAKATARMLIDVPSHPEKVENVLHRMREMKLALTEESRYRSPSIPWEEIDGGAPLEGEDAVIFKRAIRYCVRRFQHLPFDYLVST
jgi:hypothetical protein